MATEDFTTFTEVDGDGDITVTSSKVTVETMIRDVISHVHKDYTSNHFDDFEHLLTFKAVARTTTNGLGIIWGITNGNFTYGDCDANNDGILLFYMTVGANATLRIHEFNGNDNDQCTITDGNTYYLKIERSDTTTTCKIYSDSDRTNLLNTLTTTTLSTGFQYCEVVGSREGAGNSSVDFEVSDLDLQEAGAETHTPSDTAKATDSMISAVDHPFSDTAKATDSMAPKVSEPFSDLAKATDSIAFKVFHSINDIARAQDIIFPNKLTLTDTAKANDSVTYSYETLIETPTENINIYR